MTTTTINWKHIAVFYTVAVGLSALFRLDILTPQKTLQLGGGFNIVFFTLKAIGPIAGFFVLRYLLNNRQDTSPNTFWGNSKTASLIAVAVIPVMMTILGVKNSQNLNIHYFGLLYSTTFVIYALFEEYGWRGYLQNALSPMPMLPRLLTIAVLWFAWHLNFITSDMTVKQHLMHFGALLLGAWGLMKITEKTQSLLFATAVHLSFNLLTEVNGEFQKRLIVLAVAVVTWVVLLRVFTPKDAKIPA